MRDEKLVEPIGVPEYFVDGFTKHIARDGVMTAIGYRAMQGGKIAVIRLVWPEVNTTSAIDEAMLAMQQSGAGKRAH